MARTMWDSSVGKKTVMAVSGLIMLLYLVVHMIGNMKIYFGADEFNHYAHWLRTVGEPFMHYEWTLWIIRVVLVVAVVAHATSAYQLSRRDIKARPSKYVHSRPRASYATRTMRWGGIILGLFIETSAAIIVLAPILAPVAMHFGVDPVHFGLIMVVNLALGMITPPFGVNLFAACTVARISLDKIIRHLIPFVCVILACLLIITYVPALSLGLRDLVYR